MAQRSSSGSSSSSTGTGTDTSLTKIFVGGLAWETQCESMRRYFEQFGEIVEAVVIADKHTGRSKGYGFVTFREPEAARRACVNPAPFIDGRRTNCNLAVLGAHRSSRPTSPLFQGTRFLPVYGDFNAQAMIGGAPQIGHSVPFAYHQGYPSPLGYPAYPPEYYAPPNIYNSYVGHHQQITHVPPFQHHSVLPASQQELQVQGGPFAMPLSPLNHPTYFMAPPFMQSPGQYSPNASQGSTPRFVLHAPSPFTPGGGGPDQQSSA